jgi:undecaprenol kinase/diacylglycerol kinase (ATP)
MLNLVAVTNSSAMNRLKSFKYAFNGLKILIKEEPNARIHLLASLVVIMLSVALEINVMEWVAVVFCIGFVLVAETFNTSLEKISDFISPEKNEKIKKIKDLAAAAVLLSALTALTTGLIIFIPKICLYF